MLADVQHLIGARSLTTRGSYGVLNETYRTCLHLVERSPVAGGGGGQKLVPPQPAALPYSCCALDCGAKFNCGDRWRRAPAGT